MSPDQPQFEKYWRAKIGNEVLDMILKSYDVSSNRPSMYDIYEQITKNVVTRNII